MHGDVIEGFSYHRVSVHYCAVERSLFFSN